jgi:hypothetical protein
MLTASCCGRKDAGAFFKASIGVFLVNLHFLFVAIGNVTLGKIVGDPWGGYTLRKWYAVADAVFMGVLPPLDRLLLLGN